MNEHREAIRLYEKKPALNCAILDDGTAFNDHTLDEYEWIMIAELDAVLRPCGPFILLWKQRNVLQCPLLFL